MICGEDKGGKATSVTVVSSSLGRQPVWPMFTYVPDCPNIVRRSFGSFPVRNASH